VTEQQALALVGHLVGSTTGWNDDSVDVYVDEVKTWDYAPGAAAVQRVVRTWQENYRPTLGYLLSVYNTELERHRAAQAELPPGPDRHAVGPAEGYEIMVRAYRAERERRGKDPDVPIEHWLRRPTGRYADIRRNR